MRDAILAVAIVIAAVFVTVAHHMLKNRPITRLAIQDFFYEQSGLAINVPEDSVVEVYADFVLIVRPDGLITIVPHQRVHAIDAREL